MMVCWFVGLLIDVMVWRFDLGGKVVGWFVDLGGGV